MDRFAAMQVFTAVVDAGSFVRAAERLAQSTTAVSRQLAELEAHLGVRLLQRTTRTMSLTEAGRLYYEQCVSLLAELLEAEAAVSHASRIASGVLRVNAPVSFAVRHLAPLLPQFRAQQPQVGIELTVNDRVVDLVDEGFDLALRISRQALASTLIARPLAPIHVAVCASPAYLARFGTPASPRDLGRHQCLGYSYTDRGMSWEFAGTPPQNIEVNGFLRANNGDVLVEAAIAGAGIIAQPSFLVGDALRDGRLVRILATHPLPQYTAWAVYPSRRFLSAKVRSFVDFLGAAWGEVPPWDTGL
ncbi:LysR family transcriptional regulator [Jeongeupia sp. HS-3]|uniref:LysR family transcriptional regulator n=1 Tax=Jeongeupia sp. HS-3 TaxID=1009682 RepID=UPI0018A3EC7E|nr:LysR family transcriptional regulator [Jeongeupia sp. HS-3]BCL74864.1 LysR family transcriptional regulator [Jeongeupia sp. HS-3]